MKLSHHSARKLRQVLFFIHLWTGVILGLWLVMIGLTGSVLAWPELIGAEMKMRFPYEKTSVNQPQIPLSQAIASIKKAQPDISAQELSLVILPFYRFPYYIFTRQHKPFDSALFLVDPYSGKVNKPLRVQDFITGKIEFFHTGLIIGPIGFLSNGILSFFTIFLLISGIWLWWPATVRQLKLRLSVKRKAPLRRLLMDLHNVMGIYLYVILFVTTITAVLLVANTASQDGIEKAIDGKPATLTIKAHGARLSDDVLVQRAHAALPNATLMYLMRPMTPDAPFVVNYEKGSYGFLRNGKLLIDPYSGKTLQIESDRAAAAGHKTMALMEDLHYGLFGGIWTKLLYTITGLLPLGLFVSGLLMWWKRKQARAKVKAIAAVK
jgi:uncharacterized iron-regulated membrane protein